MAQVAFAPMIQHPYGMMDLLCDESDSASSSSSPSYDEGNGDADFTGAASPPFTFNIPGVDTSQINYLATTNNNNNSNNSNNNNVMAPDCKYTAQCVTSNNYIQNSAPMHHTQSPPGVMNSMSYVNSFANSYGDIRVIVDKSKDSCKSSGAYVSNSPRNSCSESRAGVGGVDTNYADSPLVDLTREVVSCDTNFVEMETSKLLSIARKETFDPNELDLSNVVEVSCIPQSVEDENSQEELPIVRSASEQSPRGSTCSNESQDSGILVDEPPVASPPENKQLLPPCRVCGEKASGFHYGVNTCEACKGFFRRSLHRAEGYKCAESGRCRILPGKRNSCAACRLAKCMNLGMSRSAIKTGRYTHEKRARDIREVKKLERRPGLSDCMSGSSGDDGDDEPAAEVTNSQAEEIIHVLTAAYISSSHHTADYMAKLPEREKVYLDRYEMEKNVYGSLKPLEPTEYTRIYQTTRMDVDGRQALVKDIVPNLERSIQRFVTFAKMLPGFSDFSVEDQISLVKAARFECWLLSSHQSVNSEKGLYTDQQGKTIHRDEMIKVENENYIDEFFRAAKILQRLKLKQTEIALLQAICIVSPDRCELSDPAAVEKCQEQIVDALLYYQQKHYPNDPLRFARLIAALCELRTAEKNQERCVNRRFFKTPDVDFPALVREMWTS